MSYNISRYSLTIVARAKTKARVFISNKYLRDSRNAVIAE